MASRTLAVLLGILLAAAPASAAFAQKAQAQPPGVAAAQAPPDQTVPQPDQAKPPATQKKGTGPAEEQAPRYEEQVVVTASKVEQQLVNAPATVSVIGQQVLDSKASQDYAGLFRAVPGVNVTQTSARDLNITSRGATGTLSTTQLALIDGRSVYLDFFGFVGWDFLPVNFAEIRQIEVIRGPASAVWGANAMTGVVNIITKAPREMQGTSVTMGFGTFNRSVDGQATDPGNGGTFYTNLTHAGVVNNRWSYKVSAGFYGADPFARPVGTIDNAFKTPYPSFSNTGTEQPKFDGRVDYDFADGRSKLVFAGGYAGTSGIIHTGIGPFQIEQGTHTTYAKGTYTRNAFRAQFFTNMLDGTAPALLSIGVDGKPIIFDFSTRTYDVELSNISTIGTRHVLSYGGNIRHNGFDLSIAPLGSSRNEQGVYVQDEMFLSERFRWQVGVRMDHFDVLDDVVFSPRTTILFKPEESQTLRASYNKAYRAPSLTNNFLDVTILNQLDLGALNPGLAGRQYAFPVAAVGNQDLGQHSLDAFEIGYSGVIADRASVSAAWYYNIMVDEMYFTQVASYSSSNVPPGWPLPPSVLDQLIAANAFGPGLGLPSGYSYLNSSDLPGCTGGTDCGKVRTQGIELGVDVALTNHVNAFANYSWQSNPSLETGDIPDPRESSGSSEYNFPPNNRFNAGFNVSYGRYFGDLALSYQGEAYWQDVLDARYAGTTGSFTLLNGGFGVRWMGGRLVTSLKGTNLANQDVMQHVFGDVIKRSIVGEVRVTF
ncbi:MAG: TonB-dependent receptor [Vicinamibacterales bacterium]